MTPVLDRLVHMGRAASTDQHDPIALLAACSQIPGLGETSSSAPSSVAITVASPVRERLLDVMCSDADVTELLFSELQAADQSSAGEIATAVKASARFAVLPASERDVALDRLEAAITDATFLDARLAVLDAARSQRSRAQPTDRPRDPPTLEEDESLAAALCAEAARQLDEPLLAPLGFPPTTLGLLSLAAAARAGGSARAAASLGRACGQIASSVAPLTLVRAAHGGAEGGRGGSARTLVVAFSSLGWHGLMRAEWLPTLRAAAAEAAGRGGGSGGGGGGGGMPLDVAHCIDATRSWFFANPLTGAVDDGRWWDASLAELCGSYDRVWLVGESMGGTGALLHARHATTAAAGDRDGGGGGVVALVPQVDLRDFGALCGRRDDGGDGSGVFDDAAKGRLRDATVRGCTPRGARITVHVGRDADDLYQLSHLPALREAYAAVGEEADAPLPRDGVTRRHAVQSACGAVRGVKHDVEGHALGAGLRQGGAALHRELFADLFAPEAAVAETETAVAVAEAEAAEAAVAAVAVAEAAVAAVAVAVAEAAEAASGEGAADPAAPATPLPGTAITVSSASGADGAAATADDSWAVAAASSLAAHGFCVLTSAPSAPPLVPREVTGACRLAASDRLTQLLGAVERRGVDLTDEFRFEEVVHRQGLRYDMPMPWGGADASGGDGDGKADGKADGDGDGKADGGADGEAAAFGRLHAAVDIVARTAMSRVAEREGARGAAADTFRLGLGVQSPPIAGCVTSVPSATAQAWHSDGGDPGMFNVFVPLVPLTRCNGPTQLQPGSHRGVANDAREGSISGGVECEEGAEESWVAPLLGEGELLIFDYRVRHRGLPNDSDSDRPVAYVTYALGDARDTNFPAAATLAWD